MTTQRFLHQLAPELAALVRPEDDLRHPPAEDGRMRDSLFWQASLADEKLCLQIYFFATEDGNAGYNICLWGAGIDKPVLDFHAGKVAVDCDFAEITLGGLVIRQNPATQSAEITYSGERLKIRYEFNALHAPFSYRANPDGLPEWMARNRIEQTGALRGEIVIDGRQVTLDGQTGHRDHSWGLRDWAMPHHWKWLAAYTADGAISMNGWIWYAGGERGVAGYVARDGRVLPITAIREKTVYDDDMMQQNGVMIIDCDGGAPLELHLDTYAAIRFPSSKRNPVTISEAGCAATLDGRPGSGQFETHWQTPYLDYLRSRRQPQPG